MQFTGETWDYRMIYIDREAAQPLVTKIKNSVSFFILQGFVC